MWPLRDEVCHAAVVVTTGIRLPCNDGGHRGMEDYITFCRVLKWASPYTTFRLGFKFGPHGETCLLLIFLGFSPFPPWPPALLWP